jgi:hypothetical protein
MAEAVRGGELVLLAGVDVDQRDFENHAPQPATSSTGLAS